MTIKQIEAAIEEGVSLKMIAQAYSEIANLKIKRIRSEVERNRLFFGEIWNVYALVKAYALEKKVSVTKPKKRLCILITSNHRFFGNINSSLINYFIGSTRELLDIDRLIIGKGGIDYFRVAKILPNFYEAILRQDMPTDWELADLVKIASDYNQVLVFHARFKSLLRQQATSTDITATSLYLRNYVKTFNKKADPASGGADKNFMRFIFEPELIKTLKFFDTQISTLLLEQTFLESELSRTASRFISMDQAQTAAEKFIKEYKCKRALTKRSLDNNLLLENYASLFARKERQS